MDVLISKIKKYKRTKELVKKEYSSKVIEINADCYSASTFNFLQNLLSTVLASLILLPLSLISDELGRTNDPIINAPLMLMSLLVFFAISFVIPVSAFLIWGGASDSLSDFRDSYLYLNAGYTFWAKVVFLVGISVSVFIIKMVGIVYSFGYGSDMFFGLYYAYSYYGGLVLIPFFLIFVYPALVYSRIILFRYPECLDVGASKISVLFFYFMCCVTILIFLGTIVFLHWGVEYLLQGYFVDFF